MKRYLLIILFFTLTGKLFPQITVDTGFEGSNAEVISISNSENNVKVRSVLKRGDIHNVVLYFKVKNFNPSQNFKISILINQQYYLPLLAAYSYDKINWQRFSGIINGNYKEFTNNYNRDSLYFCYGFPYSYSDMINYCEGIQKNPYVNISDVSVSELGRPVKLIKITNSSAPDSGKKLIWILGRNHAMETHSNYTVEGLINFLISNDPKAEILRDNAIVYAVPVMDADMAAIGGTGKDQLPVDFNRDWDSPSFWNAVRDVKKKIIQTASQNSLKLFIDSHNPFPGDTDTTTRFFCYSHHETGIKSFNLNNFRTFFSNNSNYYIGRKPIYLTAGQTASKWVDSMFNDIDFSVSIETGWTQRPDGVTWDQQNYRLHGEYIGKAISDYVYSTTGIQNSAEEILNNSVFYPNPTNSYFIHKFNLPFQGKANSILEFYDILGKKVFEKDYGILFAGEHIRNIDVSILPSGIYYFRFISGKISLGKIVIIK